MTKVRTCGIYKIINLVNNKLYIGQSVEIEKRWNRHKNELIKGIHKNEYLQRSWNKYGNKNFKFEIVEECKENRLDEREIYWIAYYDSNNYNKGYNLDSGGTEGKRLNDDVKKRIGESREYPKGEDTTNALLSNEQVVEIRKLISENKMTQREIGDKFNVGAHIISHIKNFETYSTIKTEFDEIIKKLPKNNIRGNRKQKLNEETVIEIKKALYENVLTRNEIAKMFGVDRGTIQSIRSLNSWIDIGQEYNEFIKTQNNTSKLTENDIKEIKKLISDGFTNKEIAEQYNIDKSAISNIKTAKTWSSINKELNEVIKNKVNKKKASGNDNRRRKFSREDIENIKYLYANNDISIADIANEFKVKSSYISNILNQKFYSYIETIYDEKVQEKLFILHKSLDNKSKLTSEDIPKIKKLMVEGKDDLTISQIFNVTKSTINSIRVGRKWTKIKTEYDDLIKKKKNKINGEIAKEIKNLINEGFTDEEIAAEFSIAVKTINDIRYGRTWNKIVA